MQFGAQVQVVAWGAVRGAVWGAVWGVFGVLFEVLVTVRRFHEIVLSEVLEHNRRHVFRCLESMLV